MVFAVNKSAKFNYHILDTWEAGLVLTGQEVKSVRGSQITLKDSYVAISGGAKLGRPQASLLNCHIAPYRYARVAPGYKPDHSRRLLLHRRDIITIFGQIQQKGLTVIPLAVYSKGAKIKVEIALVKGKKQFDKRETIRRRDLNRDVARQLKRGA
ncbi:MAG: SsrA-binding protein SmpB [Patescibacteria group bacterium]